MGHSPYPAQRVKVRRSPAPLPGSPRVRTVPILDGAFAERIAAAEGVDDTRLTGSNPVGDTGHVWGRNVAPVTGRKARKSAGWTTRIAGGEYIVAQGV